MSEILAHSNSDYKPTKKINVTVESMELKDRIREAMDGAGLKKLQFANKMGKSSGAVTQWLQGTTKALKAETASKMDQVTGYRADWIVTGKGEKKAGSLRPIITDAKFSPEATVLAGWLDMLPADQRLSALNELGNTIAPWLQGIQPMPAQSVNAPAKKPVVKPRA